MANIRISAMPLASTLDGDDLLAFVRVDGIVFTSQRVTLAQLKSYVVSGLAIADVTGLQAALDGKAAVSHTHAILDVTGLQAALDGKLAKAGDTMTGALTLAGDPTLALHAAPKQYVDTRVLKAGDTMTGALTLPAAAPTDPNHATRKGYVDTQDGLRVLKAGDTMTGALTLPAADPTGANEATRKSYVDALVALRLLKAGDTMTGPLVLSGDPTLALHAAPKQYVDTRVLKAGDTMTGALTLSGNPTLALHAATKQYVDNAIANAAEAIFIGETPPPAPEPGNLWWHSGIGVLKIYYNDGTNSYWVDATPTNIGLALSGGTLTGPLFLPAVDPTDNNQAVRKAYVDTNDRWVQIASVALPTGANFVDVNWTAGAYREVRVTTAGAKISANTTGGAFVQVARDGTLVTGGSDYAYAGVQSNASLAGLAATSNIFLVHGAGINSLGVVMADILLTQDVSATRTIGFASRGYCVTNAGTTYASHIGGELVAAGTGLLSGFRFGCTAAVNWAAGRLIVMGLKS